MSFLKKIKNLLSRFKRSEFERLRSRYEGLPRRTPALIRFRSFVFETTDAASVVWQIKEIFFDERLKFQSTSPAPVILDCGANVGIATVYFKTIFPAAKITAFEADPKIAALLEKNLSLNAISSVAVEAKAVWKDGLGVNFSPDGADGGSVLGSAGQIAVPSVRLKDIIEEKEQVDMLKLDIEGAETEALLDCGEILRKVRFLFVEYHSFADKPQTLDKILFLLSANGFRYRVEHGAKKYPHFTRGKMEPDADFQVNIYAVNQAF